MATTPPAAPPDAPASAVPAGPTHGQGHDVAGQDPPAWLGVLQGAVTLTVLAGAVGMVLQQLQPQFLLSDTTPAGGDMGAHVWAPAFLREELLSQWRLAGWSGDWYGGFPAMQFYMVVPMLAIVALSFVLPYGVAFKLVSVSGVVAMPAAAYVFGRCTRLPFPTPALLAVAAALFVFDRSYSIYGGNVASTLAGEFAFSISLALAIAYLGVVGRGLAEGTHRVWAAVLLALTGLCHVIPTFFAIGATVAWFLAYLARDSLEALGSLEADRYRRLWATTRARLWWLCTTAPVAGLLVAFWMLPFVVKSRYLNDMGWQKVEEFTTFLVWREGLDGGLADFPTLTGLLALAGVGVVVSFLLRQPAGVALFLAVAGAAIAFVYLPQGRLWNTRVLGFYYLGLGFLGAIGLGLLPRVLGVQRLRRWLGTIAAAVVLGLQLLLFVAPGWLPLLGEVEHRREVEVCDAAGVCATELAEVVWDPARWAPFLVVGLAVVAVVAAVEVATTATGRRRRAAWVALGAAGLLVLAAGRLGADWAGVDRLGGWTWVLLLVVAVGASAEVLAARGVSGRRARQLVPAAIAVSAAGVAGLYLALPLQALGPFGSSQDDGAYHAVVPTPFGDLVTPVGTHDRHFVGGWAAWNYRGYESTCPVDDPADCGDGRKRYFPELHALVTTMGRVAEEHGCGRAMWEYSPDLDRYGTPMALMLLPHWTDRCVGSMEGLYFEASTSTPYHFINQDLVSERGSNAQRGMPYVGTPGPADFDRGIRGLQMLGVRYYLTYSEAMGELARAHPALTPLATSPAVCLPERCPEGVDDPPDRWVIFAVADSDLVVPLENEPVVLTGVGGGHTCESVGTDVDPRGRHCEGWLDPAVDWFTDETLWSVPITEDGPPGWARVPVEAWMQTREAPVRPLPPVAVGDIVDEGDALSFSVDRVGVPVVVRTSYFPNWRAHGAEGPYRIAPNLMVVVPTEQEVRLTYGWEPVDLAAWALTFAGLALLVVLGRRPPVVVPPGPVGVWHQRRVSRG